MGMPKMDEEGSDCFEVHRAPSGKFYMTRHAEAICTRSGSPVYFETQREALEFLFLAEIGDIVLHRQTVKGGAEGEIRRRVPVLLG
jgi:hypothetical protein